MLQGPIAPIIPLPVVNQTEQELAMEEFLNDIGEPPAELETGERMGLLGNWRATKVVGDGNYGVVGLFEYDPLAPSQPVVNKVRAKLTPKLT